MLYKLTSNDDTNIDQIQKKNISLYTKYLQSCYIKNEDTFYTTYKTYKENMRLFLEFLKEYYGNLFLLSSDTLDNFTDIWESYVAYCMQRGNNKRTINNKKTAISTFFDWCVKRKYININPFTFVEKIKITKEDKRRESFFLTTHQIWEINYVMDHNPKKYDLQTRLLFNLFLDSGCRISEVWNLTIKQLDIENMIFTQVRHKEGYIEDVLFFEKTKELLLEWLRYRKDKKIENDYIFLTNYKGGYKHMSKETIRDRVRKIGMIVNIPNFYPHSIRKSILNITGQQSEQLAAALGHHKDTKVTREHYMKKETTNFLRESLKSVRRNVGL